MYSNVHGFRPEKPGKVFSITRSRVKKKTGAGNHKTTTEEEEEEEEEDLIVFNDTIEGPRAPAVKPGRVDSASP